MLSKFLSTIVIFTLLLQILNAQINERYFDTAPYKSNKIRIAILHPSYSTVKSIIALRKEGLLPSKNTYIIGVYHKNESKNYIETKRLLEKEKLFWFKLHRVDGDLNTKTLFRINSCSKDFSLIFSKTDGIIFFGGADIPPRIYNEPTSRLTAIYTPYRSYLEASFVFHLLGGSQNPNVKPFLEKDPKFPIFGICLGAQTLNVGTGGTMTQDIWFEKYNKLSFEDVISLNRQKWHRNPWARLFPELKLSRYCLHRIKIKPNTIFTKKMGLKKSDNIYVISSHHQAIEKLGKNIKVIATSLDGKVVEAIVHKKFHNVLGTQFHPDFPILWDPKLKIGIVPKEKKFSVHSFLKSYPPSFKFQKKIWLWFTKKVKANYLTKK